jgi:hypothetical protein
MKKTHLIFPVITLILFISGCAVLDKYAVPKKLTDKDVKDFAACAKIYPVQETFPLQCKLPDGTVFVEVGAPTKPQAEIPQPACKNLCGDGICQSIVCLSLDCPCAETVNNCPGDCANKK